MRLLLCVLWCSCSLWSDEEKPLLEMADEIDGYHHAASISKFFSIEPFIRGMQRFSQGKPYPQELVDKIEREYTQIWYENFEQKAAENLEKTLLFLRSLSQNPSVHFLEDGKVAYEVIEEGLDGCMVTPTSEPILLYRFQTLDGEEVARINNSIRISLEDVIPGFAKGILGMKKGERRKIFIHPDLAYKKLGNFPPNSLLIAEVKVESLS